MSITIVFKKKGNCRYSDPLVFDEIVEKDLFNYLVYYLTHNDFDIKINASNDRRKTRKG
jgi:hypothetical protein